MAERKQLCHKTPLHTTAMEKHQQSLVIPHHNVHQGHKCAFVSICMCRCQWLCVREAYVQKWWLIKKGLNVYKYCSKKRNQNAFLCRESCKPNERCVKCFFLSKTCKTVVEECWRCWLSTDSGGSRGCSQNSNGKKGLKWSFQMTVCRLWSPPLLCLELHETHLAKTKPKWHKCVPYSKELSETARSPHAFVNDLKQTCNCEMCVCNCA